MSSHVMRAMLLGTVLTTSFSSGSCNKLIDKLCELKPVDMNLKKPLDEKRIVIEKKEREFARGLVKWTQDHRNVLKNIIFVSSAINKNEINQADRIVYDLDKDTETCRKLTGFNFSIKKPNDEQLHAFWNLMNTSLKGDLITWKYSREMTLKEISERIEKRYPGLKGEKLKEKVEQRLQPFRIYQETFKDMVEKKNDLYVRIKDFNEEAKKANQPPYTAVWRIGIHGLEEFLYIFEVKK